MTQLCVPIFVHDLAQAKRDLALAAERGAEIVELRVDLLKSGQEIAEIVKASTVPTLVTCRTQAEGGQSELSDAERLGLLLDAAQNGATYLDIELATVNQNRWAGPRGPRDSRPGWIYSAHDFVTRPANLHSIWLDMIEGTCDVAKVAWNARTLRDNLEAFELMQDRHKPTIAICMGEAGALSRILAKKFGAFLTFASLDNTSSTAPGQITVGQMKTLYRWDKIQPDTKVYGVVGSPVAHSLSPAIHNAGFDTVDFNGIYVPLLVEGSYESFKAFMESFLAMDSLHLSGLSVTIPHKENALRYLKEKNATIEPLAERIGALNTIVIDRSGGAVQLSGFSTDYAAILDSITSKLNITREDLSKYRIAVLGAGGTGRTAVAALAHYGATVVVYNRTFERAEELAKEFNGQSGQVVAAKWDSLCKSCCQIYLNTTSVGMHPNVGISPFGDTLPDIGPDTLVFDTIYNPLKTKLLEQAEAKGAKTIQGLEMFIRQAAGQFEAWTKQAAPTDVMRDVVLRHFNKKS